MRYLHFLRLFLVIILTTSIGMVNAQDIQICKVLSPELSGEYTGGCKKGLADGIGKAIGTDSYSGSFKKGFPNGKGTYNYASGAIYEGMFVNGKRNGQGKLTYMNEEKKVTQDGIWKEDNYIGVKPEPAYEIIRKENILRYSFVKTSDPRNMVMIKLIRNGIAIYPDNLLLSSSGGSVIQQRSFTGFEQLQYPFSGNIKYSLLTPFNNSYVDYELDFLIREAGSWEITLSH